MAGNLRVTERMDAETLARFRRLRPDEQIRRLHQYVDSLYAKLERLREQYNIVVRQNRELKKANKTLHARLIRERGGHPEQQLKDLT